MGFQFLVINIALLFVSLFIVGMIWTAARNVALPRTSAFIFCFINAALLNVFIILKDLFFPVVDHSASAMILSVVRVGLETICVYATLNLKSWFRVQVKWQSFTPLMLTWAFICSSMYLALWSESFVHEERIVQSSELIRSGMAFLCFISGLHLFRLEDLKNRSQDFWISLGGLLIGVSEYLILSSNGNLVSSFMRLLAYISFLRGLYLISNQDEFTNLAAVFKSLHKRNKELEALISNMPMAAIKIDQNFVVSYANKTQAKHLGRPIENVIGHDIRDIGFANDYEVLILEAVKKALSGKEVFKRANFLDPLFGRKYTNLYMLPEKTIDGRTKGVFGFIMDVTDETQTLLELAKVQQDVSELRMALDAHAIVAVTDANGVITYVNDKFCQISQYSREELIGKTHKLINSGYHKPEFFKDLWQTISSGQDWSGEICNRAKDGSYYWVHTTIVPYVDKDGVPYKYTAIRADITPRKKAEQQAIYMATHDPLTGVANRRHLIEKVEMLRTDPRYCNQFNALLFIDLDGFKNINDTLGHECGDMLLQQVAQRLNECNRGNDLVARFGGDEFVMLITGLGDNPDMAFILSSQVSDKILDSLRNSYQLTNSDNNLTPSLGLTLFQGKLTSTSTLLKQSDLALYAAKKAGGNQVVFFDSELQAKTDEITELELALKDAVERDSLQTYYQVIVDVDRNVIGYEALLRWRHVTKGWIPPTTFIPIAERTGLIYRIGDMVLESACKQLSRWSDNPLTSSWVIAVNISPQQLFHEGFADRVLAIIWRYQVHPSKLRLELTESMLINDFEGTAQKMNVLREHGIRFSLDDFGTGYSSLGYLNKLPIEVLKIDKSFVRDIAHNSSSESITCAIISLAKSLNLRVIAEGVEYPEQFELLRKHGCTAFQGYYFGRPEPIERLTPLTGL